VQWRQADAMALPFPDDSFDAAAMALVIFFVPDPTAGVAEMARDARPVDRGRHHQQLEVLAQPLLGVARERETPLGDDMELQAVERCFGNAARGLAMSSTKSAT